MPSVTRLGLCLSVPYVCSHGIAPYLGLDAELLIVVQRRRVNTRMPFRDVGPQKSLIVGYNKNFRKFMMEILKKIA